MAGERSEALGPLSLGKSECGIYSSAFGREGFWPVFWPDLARIEHHSMTPSESHGMLFRWMHLPTILTRLCALLINHPAARYKAPSARGLPITRWVIYTSPSSVVAEIMIWFFGSMSMRYWRVFYYCVSIVIFLSFFASGHSILPGASNLDEAHSARRGPYMVFLY